MKKHIPGICYAVSAALTAAFVIKSIVDYRQYSTTLNSAPFYVWVLVNALYLLIPAIIVLVIGIIVKKKH
ncbi:MAG: hypothetical protein IKF16_03895 [Lachnospiraceae bacterium]|nr:hypothetical protein [Lachnospiraceae bacterium]